MTDRVWIAGVGIDSLTMAESVSRAKLLASETRGSQHVVVNAGKLVQAQDDPSLAAIINGCAMVNADGQAVVWASRLLGRSLPERVAGIDFMVELLLDAVESGASAYFLGAKSDVVRDLAEAYRALGVDVVGCRDGFWSPHDELEVVRKIAATQADYLFVALPSPKKEVFLARWLDELNVGLAVGVGGSFDVLTGRIRRAPLFAQRLGLEWLYRLAQEPRRMWRRYLVGNFRFLILIVRELVLGRGDK